MGTLASCLILAVLSLAGCGDSSTERTATKPTTGLEGTDKGGSSAEPASDSHLSRGDCAAIATVERRATGRRLRLAAEPSPPLSRCRLDGAGVSIGVFLDAAHAAHRRYENRVVETAQFGARDPERLPHPLAGVGDPSASGHGANWLPGIDTLLAVRGNRWLTVSYSVAGEPHSRLRSRAAALARRAFRLSARDYIRFP
jgi:hypothetical protein